MKTCCSLPAARGGPSSSSSSLSFLAAANPNPILSGRILSSYGYGHGRERRPLRPSLSPWTPLKKKKNKKEGGDGTDSVFIVSSSSSPSPSPSSSSSSSSSQGSVWDSNAENVRWSRRRTPATERKPSWDEDEEEEQKRKKTKKMEWDYDSTTSARNSSEAPPEDWRWWQSPPDDDEYQMENDFEERNDGFPWMEFDVKQAISTLSWMFPAAMVLFPWLMGNPTLMMMGFAIFPIAKRVVPGAFKLFSMFFGPPPKPKRRRRRNSSNATFNRSPIWREKFYEDQSADGLDEDRFIYPEESSEAPFDQPNDRGLKRSATGGWEDLNERSSPRQAEENLVEIKRSSGMRRTPRKRQVPLLLRLLVALFPFLRSWGGFL